MTREQVTRVVAEALDEVNRSAMFGAKVPATSETALIGAASAMDSLQLLIFLETIETRVARDFGTALELLDDPSLFEESGPLRSLAAFEQHIMQCLLQLPRSA